MLDQAIAGWIAAGIGDSQIARLEGLQVGIADLSGARLGEQYGNTITLDVNAAGCGWFVGGEQRAESEEPYNIGQRQHVGSGTRPSALRLLLWTC